MLFGLFASLNMEENNSSNWYLLSFYYMPANVLRPSTFYLTETSEYAWKLGTMTVPIPQMTERKVELLSHICTAGFWTCSDFLQARLPPTTVKGHMSGLSLTGSRKFWELWNSAAPLHWGFDAARLLRPRVECLRLWTPRWSSTWKTYLLDISVISVSSWSFEWTKAGSWLSVILIGGLKGFLSFSNLSNGLETEGPHKAWFEFSVFQSP